ncbi:hypothetical protein COV24_01500 [candidate division WWE3 bacterium CG10_big_fil_rev_8_21_14_0_10_32_10]|uniref:Uncharacterized protein n=1 Tax=candidate division WWE3 bacterium CG10_big_fil_rev_8_21_14_0_10_32_10 TaxID=1975090 RepID=A0A2H0RB02_UNCKA|nr:MAG: hypothetical protein COV24_01500 [candidate division WWE3 bacterium CG10_big_fil_rev_8_21_14_0_10_32_10]
MSLNDAAEITKKGVVYLLLFIVFYIFTENLIRGFLYTYNAVFPDPPKPPTFAYGKIENIQIRTLPLDLVNIEFRNELTTSKLPQFSKIVQVYKTVEPRVSVAKEERFKNIASILGFTDTAKKISESRRLWVDTLKNRQFDAEVFYGQFSLETQNSFLENIITPGFIPTEQESINATKDFYKQIGFWNSDLNSADYKVTPAYIVEGLVKSAVDEPFKESLKYVSVSPKKMAYSYNEKNDKGTVEIKEEYKKIFGDNPQITNISAYVTKQKNNTYNQALVVSDAKYSYFDTEEKSEYYPIINSQVAWKNLNAGKASLVYIKADGSDFFAPNDSVKNIETIDIRQIDLGYYIDKEYLKYIEPIYVFYGKYTTSSKKTGDVIFYLPALDPQGIKQ